MRSGVVPRHPRTETGTLVLQSVQVGEGTVIDPSAVIIGPTTIGRGCYIGPGAVVDNSVIGDYVNVAQAAS